MMRNYLNSVLLGAVSACFASCTGGTGDLPTRGRAGIVVSEEILPAVSEAESLFESLYPEALIDITAMTDREAIAAFFADSTKLIVVARDFNADEKSARTSLQLEMGSYTIALDAVAMIVHKNNPVKEASTGSIDSVLSGLIRDWGVLGWKTAAPAIKTIVPDVNSATHEYLSARVDGGFGPGVTRLGSPGEVIRTVMRERSALGAVGMNLLRGLEDSVRILSLMDRAAPESLDIAGKYFSPHQAWVHKGYYPFVKRVMLYYRPDSYGVTSGFISFLTGAEGQKIFLKQGLVPATMPVRLVELKSDSAG